MAFNQSSHTHLQKIEIRFRGWAKVNLRMIDSKFIHKFSALVSFEYDINAS